MLAFIKIFVLISFLVVMLFLGLRKKPSMFSWHMFSSINQCRFDLKHEDNSEFNPWIYLPHTHLIMNESEMRLFLVYLKKISKLSLTGTATLITNEGEKTITIGDTCVIDK